MLLHIHCTLPSMLLVSEISYTCKRCQKNGRNLKQTARFPYSVIIRLLCLHSRYQATWGLHVDKTTIMYYLHLGQGNSAFVCMESTNPGHKYLYCILPHLKDQPIGHNINIWSLKVVYCRRWQVQFHWNMGPSGWHVALQDRWPLIAMVSQGTFHCTVFII